MNTGSEKDVDLKVRGVELEYNTLRSEILKRVEMRQQIVSVALTLAGIFLGIGISTESVSLVYPVLAMFLAFGWAQNDYRIRRAARFIREDIEARVPELGLSVESSIQKHRAEGDGFGSWRFVVLSHGGLFLVTQLMAVSIELLKFTFSPLEWVLIGFDVAAMIAVIWLMARSGGEWGSRA